jgi:hypothetical protein
MFDDMLFDAFSVCLTAGILWHWIGRHVRSAARLPSAGTLPSDERVPIERFAAQTLPPSQTIARWITMTVRRKDGPDHRAVSA